MHKMRMMQALLLLVSSLTLTLCDHDFSSYPFKATLNTAENGGLYELYWNFDNDAENISFAVRVETTGWVGFGLSPNGQMPNSDMVIGWVTDDGDIVFHDRFAEDRAPPTIDESQDWYLKNGEEENGFTILEFSRKYITCDDKDLPVTTETARVIWSFRTGDDPTTEELSFDLIHTEKRSVSLNLLGGLPSAAPDPNDLDSYDINVVNITIPEVDTTYWCAAFKIPEEIRTQTRYVTKFGPIVTEGNEAHVHHLLIYLCNGLNDIHVGNGGDCEDGVANEVAECRGGTIIAAWAVGGELFVYPDNVAFPFGGEDFPEYLVMELHYDNPEMIMGTLDSSGMRFWYTSIPREYDAGVLELGHSVSLRQIIPPNAKNFTTTGIVSEDCTKMLPNGGIHVFANALHTHVAGHGLTVQHIRYNSDCDVYEELEPIARNLNYDFNYQQITHLPHEVTIEPGDVILLKCFYGTEDIDKATFGGLSTRDEMCLTFFLYYPKLEGVSVALSEISTNDFMEYLNTLPNGEEIISGDVSLVNGINAVDWDEDMREGLQIALDTGTQFYFCGEGGSDPGGISGKTEFPEIGCSYIAPDQCANFTPPTCCERVVGDAGMILRASLVLLIFISLLTVIMG